MKKIISVFMTLLLLWSLTLPAAAAEAAAATTLRLEKAEGTVKVSNAAGKSVTITDGMRLYSGYTIATEKSSYAYVSLDSTKAVKLDASSKAEVLKSGKKLELTLSSGNLFFNVTAPVDKDESLNIRTSTMVTGVRGTSGWVETVNRFSSRVHLLEGSLTVTSSEPATGQIRQTTITSGQSATATLKGTSQPGSQVTLTVGGVQEKQVPGFVAVAVAENPALQGKIAAKSPLSVPAIIGDAHSRLAAEQENANRTEREINQALGQIIANLANPSDPVFTPPVTGSGSSGTPPAPSPSPDPEPSPSPDPEPNPSPDPEPSPSPESPSVTTEAELTEALAGEQSPIDITSDIVLTGNHIVSSGQTLNIESGAVLTLDSTCSLTIDGTVNVSGGLANAGALTVSSTDSIHIKSGGSLTNTGTVMVGNSEHPGLLQVEPGGTLNNTTGSITVAAPVDDVNSRLDNQGSFTNGGALTNNGIITNTNSFTNSGTFDIGGADQFICSGTYQDQRSGLYIMVKSRKDNTVSYLGLAAYKPAWSNGTTVTLLGTEGGTLAGGSLTAADVLLDLNGHAVELLSGLTISESGGSLKITDTSEGKSGILTTPQVADVEQGFDTITMCGGSLEVSGGTVTSTKGFPINVRGGKVTISGGKVTSSIGTAIQVSAGSLTISGGTVAASTSGDAVNIGGGTLTVSGSGAISSTDGNGISAYNSAVVNITGGSVTSTGRTGIEARGGTVNISGTAAVEGALFGVLSLDAAVNIFGNAVITSSASDQADFPSGPVDGPIQFGEQDEFGNTVSNNVKLRSKLPDIHFKMFTGERSGPDSYGYYSLTGPTVTAVG